MSSSFLLSFFLAAYLPELANSNSFPVLEKMMSATSASHSTASSCAFFNRPPRRLENVTCLLVGFSILLISIFPRPISSSSSSWRSGSVVSVLLQQTANHYKPCVTLSCLSSSSSLTPSLSLPAPPQHLLSHIRPAVCLPANPKTQLYGLPNPRHPSFLILYNRLIIVSQQPQL
jgi:hypothetical protein